jgi:hypothetical protein
MTTMYALPARSRRMTIRDYFWGRSRRARTALVVGASVAASPPLIVALSPIPGSVDSYVMGAAGVLGAAIILGALLHLDGTNCPNCRERLGIQVANQYRFGKRFAFCPFCGVGFDKCEVRNA